MPWELREESGGWKVFKKGSDTAYSKKPLPKRQAKKQLAALYANENKSLPDEIMLIEADGKCYSEPYGAGWMTLPQNDPRVNYDPVGMSEGRACANCQWFQPGGSSCYLVGGPIVATGLSDLWMEKVVPEPEPLKVQVVGGSSVVDSEERSIEGKKPGIVQRVLQGLGMGQKEAETANDVVAGFRAFEHNGRMIWTAWWTNNFEDRKKETFPEAAIDAYIKRFDDGVIPPPQLWYAHYPIPSGEADWIDRIGHLTLAVGHFYPTEVGKKFYDYYSTDTKQREVSHGFLFPKNLFVDGVYHAFNTYEISPLPAGEACNPYTTFSVKGMFDMATKPLSPEKKAELMDILGPAWSEKYLDFGNKQSDELEALGLKFKSFGDDPVEVKDDVARQALQAVTKGITDTRTEIEGTVQANNKAINDKLDQIVQVLTGFKQRLDDIETRAKSGDALQPRATRSAETALNPDGEYLEFMKKQMEGNEQPQGSFGLFDHIARAAKSAAPTAE